MENVTYNESTCPKSDTWFASGGKCGWAKECDNCADNPDKNNQQPVTADKDG